MKEVFNQDLSKEEKPGGVFIIKLLFKKEPKFPAKETVAEIMEKRLGNIDLFWHDDKGAGLAAKDHIAHFKDEDAHPQLMFMPAIEFNGKEMGVFERSQMWDCPDKDKVLDECRYQVICTDMLAAVLPPLERANLDMDFAEAVTELFPDCEAILFLNSQKLFLADELRNHRIPKNDRFIKFAVNVRFFTIQGTNDDMIVDTLGMSLLYLPDLQYHFHGMNPDLIVNHAYCSASYILSNENPIKSGDPIDSITEKGEFDRVNMWKCSYENALIQPAREVIDVYMNEFAAGQR